MKTVELFSDIVLSVFVKYDLSRKKNVEIITKKKKNILLFNKVYIS